MSSGCALGAPPIAATGSAPARKPGLRYKKTPWRKRLNEKGRQPLSRRRRYKISSVSIRPAHPLSETAERLLRDGYFRFGPWGPGLTGPSTCARVRPDGEWLDSGCGGCACDPACTASRRLPCAIAPVPTPTGDIRLVLRTSMAHRGRKIVRDTGGRIVYKRAHAGYCRSTPYRAAPSCAHMF